MQADVSRGEDVAVMGALLHAEERPTWHVAFRVDKRAGDWTAEQIDRGEAPVPYETIHGERNALLTAGITRMLNLLIGAGGQAYNNTNARIGVGNGTTAVNASDTDLSAAAGASNRQFKLMDATYPQVAANVVTFRASFGDSEANFQWNEWGIDNGSANGTTVTAPLLNRRVPATNLGTKTSGTWTLTVTITIS